MQRLIAPFLALALLAPPVSAQDAEPPTLMERGAQMFLEGLLREMEPAVKGMQQFAEQMGPALRDLMTKVEDWSVYEAPEMLPNGDIIIRRKPPVAPQDKAPEDIGPQGETEI